MSKEEKMIGIECADIYLRFSEIMKEEFDDLTEFLEDEHIRYEGATDIFIDLQNRVKKQKEVIDKIKRHCEIEINASNHYLKNHSSQQELCHKVAHQRILDILKEVSE